MAIYGSKYIFEQAVPYGRLAHTTSPKSPSSSQLRSKSQRTLSMALLSRPFCRERSRTQLRTPPGQEHSFLPR